MSDHPASRPIRCVVISEIPVSYRSGLFDEIHRRANIDLRVVYLAEGQSDRPWETGGSADGDWISVERSLHLGSTAQGYFPRLTPGLGHTLSRLQPDTVVLPGWAHPACWQAALWCRRHHRPYGVMAETWHQQAETRLPTKLTSTVRDRILAGSALGMPAGELAADYLRHHGAPHVKVVHANTCDAVSIAEKTADVSKLSAPSVVYIGRLMEHKGASLVIGLARRLADHGITMRIAGDGPMRAEIEALAQSIESVEFVGPVAPDTAHRLMAEATVVVVPSLKEPWGVVLHEALACGTPVVATNQVGSAADLIGARSAHHPAGVIVEPNLEDLVTGCVKTVEHPASSAICRQAALAVNYESTAAEFELAADAIMGNANARAAI